ncbi:hypothetical protein UFOVP208_26 [uncultured Caudovirales phage]|uniref:Uncharacterized protein n=1 Tax=uncultured Caudovirales phage TaxID=2100421 RepID=A0A6J7WIP0_9CAUD|nr:hypothetical protein UFOVP208_26 [uncultured Caudovirales phage]
MENEEQKLPDSATEETFTDEGIIEFTSASEYIASAYYALAAVLDMDEMQYGKDSIVQQRIKRIKRKSLKIIDICISEMYDELFENTDEE